ncbi:MAG TPA: protein phosphatase 2C domain-containing protein, partial [Bryobacteraceae bacterium]|nr:protein phosphatase 2C domain-containing protein [Bryobacteraceae bacterium]
MQVRFRVQQAVATDTGLRRTNNEDRAYVDPERGIYAVIDGVGGHAAGEEAADCAVEVLRERLSRQTGTPEERLREAIALANNEIFERARSRPEWAGMACVLTVALIEDDLVTVGHVGDSRLYLLRPGEIEKKTRDHSPVGEREDRGELTEEDAMRHSRRNEIYRDVGSAERAPDDPGFIDIIAFPMPADGALLLCSDGLTDQVTSAGIRAGVERYAPDFNAAVRSLVEAANSAGGKDNVTVILVAGPEYASGIERTGETSPWRPVDDSSAASPSSSFALLPVALALFAGLALGAGGVLAWQWFFPASHTIVAGSTGINAALNQAHPGDTVVIPDGKYRETIQLREGVTVRAMHPGAVTLASADAQPAILARRIDSGAAEGLWIVGDENAPLTAGIRIDDASPLIANCKITGANVGIEVRGLSSPMITSNQIVNNTGAGIEITGPASPKLSGNLIA